MTHKPILHILNRIEDTFVCYILTPCGQIVDFLYESILKILELFIYT